MNYDLTEVVLHDKVTNECKIIEALCAYDERVIEREEIRGRSRKLSEETL